MSDPQAGEEREMSLIERRQHIGGAIERAAQNLPEGFEIRIIVERGSAVVWLEDDNGDDAVIDGSGVGDSIDLAIKVARDSVKTNADK